MSFKHCEVRANNIEDFLNKYYKKSRYTGRGKEYAELILESYREEFKERGYIFISKHESNTGSVVSWFGKSNKGPKFKVGDRVTSELIGDREFYIKELFYDDGWRYNFIDKNGQTYEHRALENTIKAI